MTQNALKNSHTSTNARPRMSDEDRKAANELLDAAMATDNPEIATRLRVVAALLHGQDAQKIRRNLSIPEQVISTFKADYDQNGIQSLISSGSS